MSRSTLVYTFLLAAVFSTTASAQWADACDYPVNIPSELVPAVDRLLSSEGLLINKLRMSGPLNGYYQLNDLTFFDHLTAFTFQGVPVYTPLCEDSIFYGETAVASVGSGRSGFLIAPNIFVTAPHGPNFDPSNYHIVFGLNSGDYDTQCDTTVDEFIPESDVYHILPGTTPINTLPIQGLGPDYMAFFLDRPVTGAQWLRLRSSGQPSKDDVLSIVGHPEMLYSKFEYGVTYEGEYGAGDPAIDPATPLFFNYHIHQASSGSAVYNLTKNVVESVVRGSHVDGLSVDDFGACSEAFYENGGRTFADQYDGQPHTDPTLHPDILNTGKVEVLAVATYTSEFHTSEVRVSPLEDVTYVLPIGGTASPATTTYTVSAPPNGQVTSANVHLVSPPAGEPRLLLWGPIDPNGYYTIPLDSGESFQLPPIQAQVPPTLGCGIYDRYFEVTSGEFTDHIRHRFEVGMKEIAVEPVEDWTDNDIGPPFTQTKTYTVRNVRPSPTTVWVYAGGPLPASMITINGNDDLVSVNLGAAGSATDSATFEIGISPDIATVTDPGIVYDMYIAFANADYECAAQDIPQRALHFKRGQRVYESEDDLAFIPAVGPWVALGSPVLFDIDLTQAPDVCAGDINLDVGFYTILGGAMGQSNRAHIKLIAPDGTSGILWNSNTDPGGAYDVLESGSVVEYLHLDDELTPPLGPQMLSAFDGEGIKGHWTVELRSSSAQYLAGLPRLDVTVGQCDTRQ